MKILFLNDQFVTSENAKIPWNDRGFLYGDGVFTTIRLEEGKLFHLDDHLKKIHSQCQSIGIEPPQIKKDWLTELVQKNRAHTGLWRLKILVSGGHGIERSLERRAVGVLLIYLEKENCIRKDALKLTIYPHPVIRNCSQVKSLSYFSHLFMKQYAIERGFDESILLSPEGYLIQASMANLFWVYKDVLYFPTKTLLLHFGVTLQNVIQNFPSKVNECQLRLDEIPNEANLFLCNAMLGTCSIIEIDKHSFCVKKKSLPLSICPF